MLGKKRKRAARYCSPPLSPHSNSSPALAWRRAGGRGAGPGAGPPLPAEAGREGRLSRTAPSFRPSPSWVACTLPGERPGRGAAAGAKGAPQRGGREAGAAGRGRRRRCGGGAAEGSGRCGGAGSRGRPRAGECLWSPGEGGGRRPRPGGRPGGRCCRVVGPGGRLPRPALLSVCSASSPQKGLVPVRPALQTQRADGEWLPRLLRPAAGPARGLAAFP